MFGNKCLIANGGLGTKEALKGTEKNWFDSQSPQTFEMFPKF